MLNTRNASVTGQKPTGPRRALLGITAAALAGASFATFEIPSITTARAQEAQTIETPMGRAPITFADIIEKVKPSVVSISVVAGGKQAKASSKKGDKNDNEDEEGNAPQLPEGLPNELFKNLPKGFPFPQQQRPTQAQGSGFVITPDGYVVTNNHVIENASKIQVQFDGQDEKFDAELVGTDPRTDIALIKIKGSKTFPTVKFDDKPARVGDWVLAVGNPFGLGGTVTAGIVSALGRDIGSGPYDFLQIDAAVNKGNSGGPTFNLKGEVIGVNTAIFSPSGGNVGIAFAVPAHTVQKVVADLKASGSVSRGWLGVKIQNVDEDTQAALGLPEAKGALVSELTPNGPAAQSGIKVQDTIVSVAGEKISDSRDLARKIADHAPDTAVDVKILRNGKEESVKVKLGKFPGSAEEIARLEQGKPADDMSGTELDQLGLTIAPVRGASGKDGVTIMEVDPESNAAEKGLKAGDVITEVSGSPVSSPKDLIDGVKKAKDQGRTAVMLQVKSQDQTRFVPVQFSKKG